MTQDGLKKLGLLLVLPLLLYTQSVASVESEAKHAIPEWGNHKQMLMRLSRNLKQKLRLRLPAEAIHLDGELLSAQNFLIEGPMPLSTIQDLQREYPDLNRLELAKHRLVLSGVRGDTHCMLQIQQKASLRQELMLSCAKISGETAKALIPHAQFKVLWSWHERHANTSVYQQIIEVVAHSETAAKHLIRTRLSELGWTLQSTEQGMIATKLNRYLLLRFLKNDQENLKAYLIETHDTAALTK